MTEYVVATLAELTNVLSRVVPGDVVRIRGGTYQPTSPVLIQASGVTFEAYPGEKVVFDGSQATYASLGDGWQPPLVQIGLEGVGNGNRNVLRNIEVRNNPAGEGIRVYGSDNVFDHVESHHNRGSGFDSPGSRNQFLYCIGHDNVDSQSATPGGDADGFGTQEGSTGNYFLGCEAYGNSDDGIDLWGSMNSTVEKCVCHSNGLLQGDGRGFAFAIGARVSKCVAYNNRSIGFSLSNHPNNTVDHCTTYNNPEAGFIGWTETVASTLTNNIGANVFYEPVPVSYNNTWDLGITDPAFISTDPLSPDFLSLLSNSPCRGKASDGTDIGALQYGEKISDLLGGVAPTPSPPIDLSTACGVALALADAALIGYYAYTVLVGK